MFQFGGNSFFRAAETLHMELSGKEYLLDRQRRHQELTHRDTPKDPIIQSLVKQAKQSQLTRRGLLLGAGGGAAALALAACSPGGATQALTPAKDVSASDKTVRWANWAMYMDEDDQGNYPTLLNFEEQTGITVTYMTDVDDNNTYYGKVKDQLALGQDIGADMITLTEWMIARLVRLGYVQDLDLANIPNIKNLAPALASPDFDPGRNKSLPWQGGFTGLCWNKEKVPEGLSTVNDLWKAEYKGRVGVLSEMRDTMGLLMLNDGVDVTGDWGTEQFNAALDILSQKIADGQIRNVKGGSYTEDLQSEDTLVTMAWSGDVTVLNAEVGYEKFGFAIPDAGGMLWTDTSVVPM